MGWQFETRDLRLVIAIAEEGSITGAAHRLRYTQPTVSHHLAVLETKVGGKLVERGARGVRLTDLGRSIAEPAASLIGRLSILEADVRRHVEHGVAMLRFGTFPSAGLELVPRAMATWQQLGMHVTLIEDDVARLIDALERRELHAAVVFHRSSEPRLQADGVCFEHLFTDDHLVVLPAEHPATANASVKLADLRGEQWIAAPSDDDPTVATFIEACRLEAFEPELTHRVTSFAAGQGLVAAGLGLLLLPRIALVPLRDDVAVRPLSGSGITREVSLAHLASLPTATRDRLVAVLRPS